MAATGFLFKKEVCIFCTTLLFSFVEVICLLSLLIYERINFYAFKSIHSLEGPILDLIKRLLDKVGSENSTLRLRCRSLEDDLGLLNKQVEASKKSKTEYLKRYEDAIKDKNALAEEYMGRISNLQSNATSLREKCASLRKSLDSAKAESVEWQRKYEQVLSKQKAEEDHAGSEIAVLKSRCSAGEARLAAAKEQAQSAQEEAEDWKRKYDIAFREAKAALEKAAIVQERSSKETQRREDALREEFTSSLAEKVISLSLSHTHSLSHTQMHIHTFTL